ncbi:MAG: AraC family transcriptional regulator, partial [Lachnospiraceae bacterium]|nr:AraC family transcriptional regulator [Lachnospiraceae bacterium]
MQIYEVETDESLRSILEYGTPEFPFTYYYDEINRYHEKSVEWHWHNELELS